MFHANSQNGFQSQQQQQQMQQQQQQQQQQHIRQRSQTVPFPGDGNDGVRRGSGSKGPVSPPTFNLIEASAPRDSGFGTHPSHGLQGGFAASFRGDQDRLGLGGTPSSAATAAANVVFPRSGRSSPNVSTPASVSPQPQVMAPPPIPIQPPMTEKVSKSERAKAKLFSRPSKISTKGESKDKPLPSPGKIGHALSALQRANFSTSSLIEQSSSASLYSMNNSSSATIRPIDTTDEKGKEKEKKHHFLSRQRHKLKDDFHLPLSSTASNSRPTNPNAPVSLYNFNVPASPGPGSSTFSKAKKDKRHVERSESRLDGEIGSIRGDWSGGAASVASLTQQTSNSSLEPLDASKVGLHSMSLDDAWPLLRAKLLVVFEGEEIITPIEDWNRVVQMHIQYCVQRRSPNMMLDDLRDLLESGFQSLDRTLKSTAEERFIPTLVELWVFTFTSILPFLQIIFLPLDLEVAGAGTILSADKAREFWGGVLASPTGAVPAHVAPASRVLDVRRLVLTAYRDVVILPRYETLKSIFSRLSLEHLPSPLALGSALGSTPIDIGGYSTSPPEYFPPLPAHRPGTAMSIDPSNASYNSNSTTLLGENSIAGSAGGRSRAISNVSFGSHGSEGAPGSGGLRPFTPSALGSVREQNVEDSKQVTEMVGRMFQCVSVLSSLGGGLGEKDDDGMKKMVELCKMLKLNWLGRGRTGRNRRGFVGGRVRREETSVS